jgi:hypothetical protein
LALSYDVGISTIRRATRLLTENRVPEREPHLVLPVGFKAQSGVMNIAQRIDLLGAFDWHLD